MAEPVPLKQKSTTAFLLLLITLHSFLMSGYTIQDRHLTVATYFSSIRAAIDPTLFQNSIYVQAVERTNLRIGLFYDLVPFIVRFVDLETFALAQAFLSLFFMFAGLYALARTFSGSRAAGFIAALLYTRELNNWVLGSPAPYMHFFHHGLPYTYPLMLWSMVFFFRKRPGTAFFLAGISWCFHTMCTAFLLTGYFLYWLWNIREFPPRKLLLCVVVFVLPASPYIVKTISHFGTGGGSGPLWLEGVWWVASYSCNPLSWPKVWLLRAALFFLLFLLCFLRMPAHVRRAVEPLLLAVALLCLVGTVFADVYPVPLVLKLSLWRSTVVYLFFALPCIAGALAPMLKRPGTDAFVAVVLIAVITGYVPHLGWYYLPFLLALVAVSRSGALTGWKLAVLTMCLLCVPLAYQATRDSGAAHVLVFLVAAACALVVAAIMHTNRCTCVWLPRAAFVWVLLVSIIDATVLSCSGGPDIYYRGMRAGKPDPWADVQRVARMVSNKDALFIIPPHLTGFTNYSMRAILGNWAEGSTLLYLDNQFTQEWFERMRALGWNSKGDQETCFARLSTPKLLRAAHRFGADYVVSEKPKTFNLPKVYENGEYILYLVPDRHEDSSLSSPIPPW